MLECVKASGRVLACRFAIDAIRLLSFFVCFGLICLEKETSRSMFDVLFLFLQFLRSKCHGRGYRGGLLRHDFRRGGRQVCIVVVESGGGGRRG